MQLTYARCQLLASLPRKLCTSLGLACSGLIGRGGEVDIHSLDKTSDPSLPPYRPPESRSGEYPGALRPVSASDGGQDRAPGACGASLRALGVGCAGCALNPWAPFHAKAESLWAGQVRGRKDHGSIIPGAAIHLDIGEPIMSLVGNLIGFGLRQVLGVDANEAIQSVDRWFADQSQALPRALGRANDQTWRALAIALAGENLADQVRLLFASGEEKTFREEVQRFLAESPTRYDRAPADFRKKCLAELQHAQRKNLLSLRGWNPREMVSFERYTDPIALVNGAWQAVGQLAEKLKPRCPNLAKLIALRSASRPPLLVAAFAYFFRRQVEKNNELAHWSIS